MSILSIHRVLPHGETKNQYNKGMPLVQLQDVISCTVAFSLPCAVTLSAFLLRGPSSDVVVARWYKINVWSGILGRTRPML